MTLLSPHSLGDPEFAFINPSPPSLSLPPRHPHPSLSVCLQTFGLSCFSLFVRKHSVS